MSYSTIYRSCKPHSRGWLVSFHSITKCFTYFKFPADTVLYVSSVSMYAMKSIINIQ